jgi:hypothetical protein
MPERYRLFVRELSQTRFRCLLLRDPSPPSAAIGLAPQPIQAETLPSAAGAPDSPAPKIQRRWLHGLGVPMRFQDLDLPIVIRARMVPAGPGMMDFETFHSRDSAALNLTLFGSLNNLPESLTPGSEETKEFLLEVQALVDSFCCTQATPLSGVSTDIQPGTESPLVGVPALIQAYLTDEPLDQLARRGLDANQSPGPLTLAALSGYVFDLEGERPTTRTHSSPAHLVLNPGLPEESLAEIELVSGRIGTQNITLPLAFDQEPEGIYLRIDWQLLNSSQAGDSILNDWRKASLLSPSGPTSPSELTLLNRLSDHTLLISRSVGAAPLDPGEILGRVPTLVVIQQEALPDNHHPTTAQVPSYFYVDRLDARQWIDQLIHYRIELRDMLDRVVASGAISVRRERLDPPPMPKSAAVELDQDGNAIFVAEWPTGESDLEPTVWFQRRPLDACGFYGTDDDLALLEGLRQADLHFEEGADQQEPDRDWEGHPVARYLRGAYDRHGLEALRTPDHHSWTLRQPETSASTTEESKDSAKTEPRGRVLEWTMSAAELKALCLGGNAGARFLMGLRRSGASGRQVESVLRPCEHYLRHPSSAPNKPPLRRRVFQAEWLPLAPNGSQRRFLTSDHFALHGIHSQQRDPDPGALQWRRPDTGAALVSASHETFRVEIAIRTHADPRHVGGYRVYLRDVLGKEDPSFERIRQFEAVSPIIYRYRPFAVESAHPIRQPPPSAPIPAVSQALPAGSTLAAAHAFFDQLSSRLRTHPGTPRLTRTDAPPQAGPQDARPTPSPLQVRLEQLEPLVSDLAMAGLTDLAALSQAAGDDTSAHRETLRRGLYAHWRLLGPLVDWMRVNGFGRDLILPFAVRNEDDLVRLLNDCIPATTPLRWFALAVEPVSPCPGQKHDLLGTVRLCVLPGLDDVQWTGLNPHFRSLLPWALTFITTQKHLLLQEDLLHADLLPWDDSGTCHLVWNGLNDGWRHQIEVAVETLDRYAMAQAFFEAKAVPDPRKVEAPAVLDQRPLLADPPPKTLEPGQIRRLVIPRLQPPPDPPAVNSALDPSRVAFRIQESPERLYATHNLLHRVRQGPLTTLIQISYTFPAHAAFQRLGFNDSWTAPSPLTVPDETAALPEPLPRAWTETPEDEVEIADALYFLEYTVHVRFRADHQENPANASRGTAQRLPGRQGVNEPQGVAGTGLQDFLRTHPPRLEIGSDGTAPLTLPLVRQWDLLNPQERRAALHVYAGDDLVQNALHWPDLETTYTLLVRLSENVYAPLFRVQPPGVDRDGGSFTVLEPHPGMLAGAAQLVPTLRPHPCQLEIPLNNAAFLLSDLKTRLFLSVTRGTLWAEPIEIPVTLR